MQVMRTYKMRLKPTEAQAAHLWRIAAAVRMVYNAANEQRLMYGRAAGTDPHGRNSYFNSNRQMREVSTKAWKTDPDLSWLCDAPQACFSYALADLDQAWGAFFDNVRKGVPCEKPRFRSASRNVSFKLRTLRRRQPRKPKRSLTYCSTAAEFRLPKLGWVSMVKHTRIRGSVRLATVTCEGGKWFICFACRITVAEPKPLPDTVGVDLGVAIPIALSTGEAMKVSPPSAAAQERIKAAQRAVSRSKRRSTRRRARVARLGHLKRREAARVRAQLHKATRHLANAYGTVAIEDLRVSNMTRSAKGTAEAPGSNVKAKAGLNRAMLAVPKYAFRTMLEYKVAAGGGKVIAVNPAFTSQTCASCGAVDKRSRQTQAAFVCTACGYRDNADTNAAKNILQKSGAVADPRKTPSEPGSRSATSNGHVDPPSGGAESLAARVNTHDFLAVEAAENPTLATPSSEPVDEDG